ncbi:hypothetical protein ABTO38_20095, partial [Acinetobacter baumannii]
SNPAVQVLALKEAVEFAENSTCVVTLTLERLGIRVSGRRLEQNTEGKTINALRCDRFVAWEDVWLTARVNPLIEAIKRVEASLNLPHRGAA